MANTEFGYVREFERMDPLLPMHWIVVRIDGRGFSKLCRRYSFEKPNDLRALDLMNAAAVEVVRSFTDVVLAYGQSDEYSFVFHQNTTLFDRRSHKLATSVSSMFTAEYCMQWPRFFGGEEGKTLDRPFPTFDGRCVEYTTETLRDYLKWRQADCHINNLYNTTFWTMVLKGNMSNTDAENALKGTESADKNEILFSRFGINYNNEPKIYRKGTVVFRDYRDEDKVAIGSGDNKPSNPQSKTQLEREKKRRVKAKITVEHTDIIGEEFWRIRPFILASKRS